MVIIFYFYNTIFVHLKSIKSFLDLKTKQKIFIYFMLTFFIYNNFKSNHFLTSITIKESDCQNVIVPFNVDMVSKCDYIALRMQCFILQYVISKLVDRISCISEFVR